jgi:opacity protein-like surface antigen
MKKTILLGAMMLIAAAGYAQESRQDVSISGFGLITPHVDGTGGIHEDQSKTGGVLASYRYLLTPHSGLELNYSFAQNTMYFVCCGNSTRNPIHVRQQEATVAYVFGLTFKNWNPFLEGGGGGVFYTPILNGTYTLDTKAQTQVAAMFGGGVAYEISPSFDIRLQYHGLVDKVPDFKLPGDKFKTNRYELTSMPTIGIAYHF